LKWFAGRFELCCGAKRIDQSSRQQKRFRNAGAAELLDDVKFFWINRDGEIGGQSPRRGCPNGNARFVFQFAASDRKLDVNSGVVALLIFDFGFSERGLRTSAPENGLL